MNAVWPLLRKM
jgi:hypothetical protein